MALISRPKITLGKLNNKEIIAEFSGEKITSNAGIVLIAELDKKLKITSRLAECFEDYRNLSYINYSVHQLVAQRVYGLILGYEDVNDHDKLRYDPALEIALEKLNCLESKEEFLAGKSTINRLEYCPETILEQEKSRYHRIEHDSKKMEKLFVDIFLQSYQKPPRQIILDLDVTDDQVHGNQEGAFFNSYYKGVCYTPLYIFCGHHYYGLRTTSFAKATVGTIRLNFLKLGARITVSVRRILIAISSSSPEQDILGMAHSRIQAIGNTC